MEKYKGSVTTVGNSVAIQLEKGLFKQHPEFAKRARVTASVLAPGKILVSLDKTSCDASEDDPVLGAFLAFMEKDMAECPEHIVPVSEDEYRLGLALTAGVEVSDEDVIPDDVTI